MRLETERLILRPIEETDVPALFLLINDADVACNLMRVPHPYPEEDYAPWIRNAREKMERREQFDMAIVLKETSLPIGSCAIEDISWEHMRGEIGYWLGQKYWGQGYMTEAVRRMAQFAFEELGFERIHAYCFPQNAASIRVLGRAGFRQEGHIRHGVKKGDEFIDVYLYGLLREEFTP
ncbi:MAG TPA: GNAT family N-acetyltransferase [Armatimonadota bacterium]|nr:GNAT family N-acetyltransferase [Armatimonadota bacterium]